MIQKLRSHDCGGCDRRRIAGRLGDSPHLAAMAVVAFRLFAYVGGSAPLMPSLDRGMRAVQFAGPKDQSARDQGDPTSRQVITHVRDQGSS